MSIYPPENSSSDDSGNRAMRLIFGSVASIIGLSFLLFGCPILIVGVALYYGFEYSRNDWILTDGKVTAMEERESYDSDRGMTTSNYCPTVAFVAGNGAAYEVDLNECATPPLYEVGDEVELFYNPAEPRQVQIKGGVQDTLVNIFSIVLGVIGVALSGGGLLLTLGGIVVAVRRRRA